jgi:hypothetical protein
MKHTCGICGNLIDKAYSCPKCKAGAGTETITPLEQKVNKAKDLVIVVSNELGECYQVALTKEQRRTIYSILVMQGKGKIKCLDTKLSMEIVK